MALLAAGCGTGGQASAGAPPDLQNGETLFKAHCAACHTLSAAGTTGTIGPNLDNAFAGDVKQGYPQSSIENVVLDQIRQGSGIIADYTTSKDFIKRNCLNDQAKCESTPMPADLRHGTGRDRRRRLRRLRRRAERVHLARGVREPGHRRRGDLQGSGLRGLPHARRGRSDRDDRDEPRPAQAECSPSSRTR